MKLFKKKLVIYGCESRGDGDSPYLTRYTLLEFKSWQLCLHIFHRSDAEDLHDHPWWFVTLPLWRGYYDCTEKGRCRICPGLIYWRGATHMHRVELVNGKPAITLVLTGRRVREWGFKAKGVWQLCWDYFRINKC